MLTALRSCIVNLSSPLWLRRGLLEGFAPAGSIFAAGVLAFAAAVPAVAFSPLDLSVLEIAPNNQL